MMLQTQLVDHMPNCGNCIFFHNFADHMRKLHRFDASRCLFTPWARDGAPRSNCRSLTLKLFLCYLVFTAATEAASRSHAEPILEGNAEAKNRPFQVGAYRIKSDDLRLRHNIWLSKWRSEPGSSYSSWPRSRPAFRLLSWPWLGGWQTHACRYSRPLNKKNIKILDNISNAVN